LFQSKSSEMEISLNNLTRESVVNLHFYTGRQLAFFGVSDTEWLPQELNTLQALTKLQHCFSHLRNKYFSKDGMPIFNTLHTIHYCFFLYFLSRALLPTKQGAALAAHVYALNKMLNCLDLFYEVDLPQIFYFDHPIGSVIGRAKFGEYFQFRQNCTVGNNHGVFPTFGSNVCLWSGVTVVGNCNIGDNVIFSSGSYVKDQDIPSNSIVFGKSPNLIIKQRAPEFFLNSKYFIF